MGEPIFKIEYLADRPALEPDLVRWYADAWAPWYGPGGAGDAASDLAACRNRDAIPLCLVALDENDQPVGTAALKSDSVGAETGSGPWLAALLVTPAERGKGIATALVARLEFEAERLGSSKIYTSTETAGRILTRRDWKKIGHTSSLRGQIDVYRKNLLS